MWRETGTERTEEGSPLNAGVVYEVDATGHEKVLFHSMGLGTGADRTGE